MPEKLAPGHADRLPKAENVDGGLEVKCRSAVRLWRSTSDDRGGQNPNEQYGTPILDIKGYRPQYRVDEYMLPEWFRKLADEKGYV